MERPDYWPKEYQMPEHCGGEPYANLKFTATWCYHNPHKAADEIRRLRAELAKVDPAR